MLDQNQHAPSIRGFLKVQPPSKLALPRRHKQSTRALLQEAQFKASSAIDSPLQRVGPAGTGAGLPPGIKQFKDSLGGMVTSGHVSPNPKDCLVHPPGLQAGRNCVNGDCWIGRPGSKTGVLGFFEREITVPGDVYPNSALSH